MYQQHPNPMHGQPNMAPTGRPSLGVAGKKHARRAGFITHALSGLGWGLTIPVVWMISFVYVFMSLFGFMPIDDPDNSTLGDVRNEIAGDVANAPGFLTYFIVVLIACGVLAIASLIVGLIAFRRWGTGRAFGITAISAVILHIVVFPIFLGIGSVMTAFMMAFTGTDSPFADELPVSLVIITVVSGVLFAAISGFAGMLVSWLFAHAFRPKQQLQW